MQKLKTCLKTSRRFFLRSTAFAAAAAMAPAAPELSAQAPTMAQHAATKGARLASPVTLVSILQGPDSTPAFSRGKTLLIAARPFGVTHWTLQTKPKLSWMFPPGQRRIQGFRSTHQFVSFARRLWPCNVPAGRAAHLTVPLDGKLRRRSERLCLLLPVAFSEPWTALKYKDQSLKPISALRRRFAL